MDTYAVCYATKDNRGCEELNHRIISSINIDYAKTDIISLLQSEGVNKDSIIGIAIEKDDIHDITQSIRLEMIAQFGKNSIEYNILMQNINNEFTD